MDARTETIPDEPDIEEMNRLMLRLMHAVNGQAFRVFGNKVLTGPFTGMTIPARAPWDDGNSGAKLLGSYEHELHEVIETVAWRQPKVVINVGCSEGYYAIGLARKLKVPVYAFDTEPRSLTVGAEFALKNEVEGTHWLVGAKQAEELRLPDVHGHRFYLFDCEADELILVDPIANAWLVNADIVVECHDFLNANTSRILADRLARTHRVERILASLPEFRQFGFLRSTPNVLSLMLVTEKRPMPCCWLACWANKRGD